MQRFVYTCRKIEQEKRDVAHDYAKDEFSTPDELNPTAGVGDLAQNAVSLDEEGLAAYIAASNLLMIEEDVLAEVQGVADPAEAQPAGTKKELQSTMGVTRIPMDEDTQYLKATFLREKYRGKGVNVAVLDTALGAPVAGWLKPQIKAAASFVGGNALAGTHDHGSHVACCALPDEARLIHAEVLDANGSGFASNVVKGFYWAMEQGAHVISISIGSSFRFDQYETAFAAARKKGILVFVAAGNEALKGNPTVYPGAYPSATAVAAFDRTTDRKASFSSTGSYVDIASSGVNVLSYLASGYLGRMSGTSMATPLVSWIAACLLGGGYKPNEVLQALKSGARNTPAAATWEGSGVVHGNRAKERLDAKPPSPKEAQKSGYWKVQVGAFSVKANALDLEKKLKAKGYPTYLVFEEK